MNSPLPFPIEDVQNLADGRQLAIDKVGIKAIRYPVKVKDKAGTAQGTIALLNMYVQLPQHFKGTHMSRFIEILNHIEHEVSLENFYLLLHETALRLEAKSGFIEMEFPYFVNKVAPVSGVQSLMDYQVTFIGTISEAGPEVKAKILIPVTSLCPCSKKISAYGAHNQRSHVTVTVSFNTLMWVEDVIRLVEMQASSELYGLLKRPDEKYVTEFAYDNPKFVEDMVRDIAAAFYKEPRIKSFVVECENFESIHNHSAYACITSQDW